MEQESMLTTAFMSLAHFQELEKAVDSFISSGSVKGFLSIAHDVCSDWYWEFVHTDMIRAYLPVEVFACEKSAPADTIIQAMRWALHAVVSSQGKSLVEKARNAGVLSTGDDFYCLEFDPAVHHYGWFIVLSAFVCDWK